MTISDFRFYIQNVRLVDKKGKETPVNLVSDGKFQTEKVALLDFENGEGNCSGGTKELNTIIGAAGARLKKENTPGAAAKIHTKAALCAALI